MHAHMLLKKKYYNKEREYMKYYARKHLHAYIIVYSRACDERK